MTLLSYTAIIVYSAMILTTCYLAYKETKEARDYEIRERT